MNKTVFYHIRVILFSACLALMAVASPAAPAAAAGGTAPAAGAEVGATAGATPDAPDIPLGVRLGVYYGASAASSYQIHCAGGVAVGAADKSGGSVFLCSFKTGADKKLVVSRFSFAKAYAVITGAESFADLRPLAAAFSRKGYEPRAAYINGWVLVAGLYDSQGAAEQAIGSGYKKAFPGSVFSTAALSKKFASVALGGETQFVFDASAAYLRAGPDGPGGGLVNTPGYVKAATGPANAAAISDGAKPGASPARDGGPLLELNSKQYRGAIDFFRGANSDILAANYMTLNEYLYGVVPKEIEASSAAEALKAQAVTARTYTLNNIGKHAKDGFDVCPTTHCQAYGGIAIEDARASQAVDETGGRIVMYQGKPASVFYFSSSGGHTEDVRNVWGGQNYPYLIGVEDNYESGKSYNYNWETVYSASQIKTKLASNGVNIGDITGVAVTKTSEGGRAIEVRVTGTNGAKTYTGGSCASFLGSFPSQMYSVFANSPGDPSGSRGCKTYTAVGADGARSVATGGKTAVGAEGTAKIKGNGGTAISDAGLAGLAAGGQTFYFVGRGWGHGVGMSQEGAKGMANAGFTYDQIISHYFPGCTV